MARLDPHHAAIAARIEYEIWSRGLLVGGTFPFLDMAGEKIGGEESDPLVSMARSAAHALARDGKRLTTHLISKPSPLVEEEVFAWCRRRRLVPNWHWHASWQYQAIDQYYSMRHSLSRVEYIDTSGRRITDEKIADGAPGLFELIRDFATIHELPLILDVVSA